MATTESRNSTTITPLLRRARLWCSKKFKLAERDLGRLALFSRLGGLQELRGGEAECAGEDAVREGFALGVVLHHRIVIGLAGEGDLVLGAGELLLQREHVLVGLQVGILLEDRDQPAERAAQRAFRLRQALHGGRISRIRRRGLRRAYRAAARLDHRVERAALVLHVALHRLDEIRDQVVATLELHVDLREGGLVPVAQGNQAVVDRDGPEPDDDDDCQEHPHAHGRSPLVISPGAYYSAARLRTAERNGKHPAGRGYGDSYSSE